MDGIDALKELCPNDNELIRHILHSILFFRTDIVKEQTLQIQQQIEHKEAIPVRYTSNQHFYKQNEVKKTTPPFKNKQEAVGYTKENLLFHKETNIRICFDKDGNYYPKQTILKYTGQRVSWGNPSTITNYTIAHIWNKTDNPLYFSLLWNYCLIPTPFAFLTDKKDETHPIVKHVKDLIKAVSVELYNPDDFLKKHNENIDIPPRDVLNEAEKLITSGLIQVIPINN